MVWSEPHRCNGKTKIPLHPNHVSEEILRNMGEMCMVDSNPVKELLRTLCGAGIMIE